MAGEREVRRTGGGREDYFSCDSEIETTVPLNLTINGGPQQNELHEGLT